MRKTGWVVWGGGEVGMGGGRDKHCYKYNVFGYCICVVLQTDFSAQMGACRKGMRDIRVG